MKDDEGYCFFEQNISFFSQKGGPFYLWNMGYFITVIKKDSNNGSSKNNIKLASWDHA